MAPQEHIARTLVVVYSLEGTTLELAQAMANTLGADIRQIEPERPIARSAALANTSWAGYRRFCGSSRV